MRAVSGNRGFGHSDEGTGTAAATGRLAAAIAAARQPALSDLVYGHSAAGDADHQPGVFPAATCIAHPPALAAAARTDAARPDHADCLAAAPDCQRGAVSGTAAGLHRFAGLVSV